MLFCEHCETARFLQITHSDLHYDEVDGSLEVRAIDEEIECTVCGLEGEYHLDENGEETVSGGLVLSEESPVMWIDMPVSTDGESA